MAACQVAPLGPPLHVVRGSGGCDLRGIGDDGPQPRYHIAQFKCQGAVERMSSALKRALTSSSDINNVLEEALNIRSLRCSLGAVQQTLNTEATTAEKRLRFVQTYGLDIFETEKLNAESLNKLMATNLKDQIGPLQTFLSDMLSGDLFEGSASDRRSILLGQIADAKNQAGAGVAGAADTLGTPYHNPDLDFEECVRTTAAEYRRRGDGQ